jgi:hypothetical protein
MGGSSDNNSFIPKRGPATRTRRSGSRQIYIFTLVSYVLFFATLVAVAGVFLYERYIDQQLENEVAALNEEIDRFREADMDTARSFNSRLDHAEERLSAAVSLPTLLTMIENTTAETAQVRSLEINRLNDEALSVALTVETDTFDSSLFQREFYEQDMRIDRIALEQVTIEPGNSEAGDGSLETTVSFNASLAVSATAIPLEVIPTTVPPVAVPSGTSTPDISEDDQDSV